MIGTRDLEEAAFRGIVREESYIGIIGIGGGVEGRHGPIENGGVELLHASQVGAGNLGPCYGVDSFGTCFGSHDWFLLMYRSVVVRLDWK